MKNPWLFLNNLTLDRDLIDSNTTVLIGFSGYGSVGTAVLNHMVEELKVDSIGYWGTMSWFHKGILEAPITIYKLDMKSKDEKENFVLITSRLPIPVVGYEALPDAFWRWLSTEILSWNAKRYIIIGGLREEVRNSSNDSWITLIPTAEYTKQFKTKRTFKDDLSIKGPISFLLTEGTAFKVPVLAILSYCNTYDIDTDAGLMALKELEIHTSLNLESENLTEFDSTFLENYFEFLDEEDEREYEEFEEEYDEEFEGYDEQERKSSQYSSRSRDVNRKFRNNKDDLDKYK
ncbi:MAG: PAC2 family protein [Candidatus Heimdallarchaeota archaeon]|nr:PAC2 family protein [Candidatus Heimdallarchaeota archaeon]MCK4878403.1 PAC2 family protein [Candidatus Heimdallarchaeota archaeon]